jgi:hypothetical protein
MDFVTLANDVSQITDTLLRHLSQQGDDNASGELASASTTESQHYSAEEDMITVPISTPFLSPTAEGELYLVATNFLLCELFTSLYSIMLLPWHWSTLYFWRPHLTL